jgi:hypothetical protein
MLRISIIIILSIFLVQCRKKKETASVSDNNDPRKQGKEKPMNELMTIHADINYKWPGTTDPYDILETRLNGDTLAIKVQYGGGCEPHDFQMHQNMHWKKSMPPQLNIYLEHKNNNDMCRALITQDLYFDLSTCRYNKGNSVILILNGDRERRIDYTYE